MCAHERRGQLYYALGTLYKLQEQKVMSWQHFELALQNLPTREKEKRAIAERSLKPHKALFKEISEVEARLQELHEREKAAHAVTVTKREVQRFLDVAERTKSVDAFHGNYLECVVAAQVQKRVEGVSELFE